MISDQKNLYVEQYQLNSDDKSSSSWTPTTATENGHFLALHFLTEIVQKSLIRQYWSTGPLLQTSVFYQVITRSRFEKILQFLNFADNSKYDATDLGRDKLFKVRDILDFLVDCFKTVYIPSENISINEKLLLYKGRLLFKQYVPSKRAGFGIKLFSLCEDSGYLWNSFLYLGKTTIMKINTSQKGELANQALLLFTSLLSDLLGLGYKLFVDNWYTSEALFDYLYENKTCAVETARKIRLKLPKPVTDEKLGRGQFMFRRKENMLVVSQGIVNVRKRSHGDVQKPKFIKTMIKKWEGCTKAMQ